MRPRAHGGNNSIHNQQLLHRHCHDLKTLQDRQVKDVQFILNSEHPW
ncbi:HNH endonuclease signature motif containing protein [Leptolyngbya sp. FACHB-711]